MNDFLQLLLGVVILAFGVGLAVFLGWVGYWCADWIQDRLL